MARRARSEASRRRQTAYHEAGHTVVAWAVGWSVGGVRILESGDGGADIDPGPEERPPVDHIAVALAGVIAGNMSGEPRAEPRPYSSDMAHAYNAEARAYPDDDDAQRRLGRRGRDKARRILRRHQPTVVRLATALERQGQLSEEEVRGILDGAA